MTITPTLAFDVCHEVYQAIRGDLEGIAILDPTKPASDHVWRPNSGPRAGEYVADFALCCKRGLEGAENSPRLQLCFLYYLRLIPYERVRNFIGIREDTWVTWTEDIRLKVGRELMQRGVFPIRNYFGERSRSRKDTKHCFGRINGKVGTAANAQV